MWVYNKTDELYHHGVIGMKWGVRRYQKKDGTRTALGKKRQRQMSDDAKEAARIKKKHVSEMTNDELRKLNDRQNLEANYKRLNPNAISKGMAIVGITAGFLGSLGGLQKNGKRLLNEGKVVVSRILKK